MVMVAWWVTVSIVFVMGWIVGAALGRRGVPADVAVESASCAHCQPARVAAPRPLLGMPAVALER